LYVGLILVRDTNPNWIHNAFIGAVPKHPFIKHLIDKTVENVLNRNKGMNPLDVTGPTFFGRVFKNYFNMNEIASIENPNKILVLQNCGTYVKNGDTPIIKIKYDGWESDRPDGSHYSYLYKIDKIFINF